MKDRFAEFLRFAQRYAPAKGMHNDDRATRDVTRPLLTTAEISGSVPGAYRAYPAGAYAAEPSQSEFARSASRIGHGIHATSQKLQRLAQAAKRTSMFDDPAQEINDLTAVIKQDITALNTAISELQEQMPTCGGYFEAGSSKQGADHSMTVVESLKQRLMGATREFKEVLTLRQGAIKAHADRRQLFSAEQGAAAAGTIARQGLFSGGGSLQQGNGQQPAPLSSANNARAPVQTQLQVVQHDADNMYMRSRAEALQNIEHTINELGSIFTQLATMVAEQGELAVRIDENMEDSLTNVENAQTQLLKYFKSISGNRWLIMKVFGVIMVFLLIFLTLVA